MKNSPIYRSVLVPSGMGEEGTNDLLRMSMCVSKVDRACAVSCIYFQVSPISVSLPSNLDVQIIS